MKFQKLIVVDSNNIAEEKFKEFAEKVTVYKDVPQNDEEIIKRIGSADAVIFDWALIKPKVFDACKNVKYLGVKAASYGWFDWQNIVKKEITVTYISSEYAVESVAEFTILHLLSVLRKINENSIEGNKKEIGNNAKGKTLGIVGLGKIGKRVAELAESLGMNILYYSRKKKDVKYKYLELKELLKQSDIVSLHLSLNKETEGIIDAKKINLMKDNSILLNLAHTKLFKEDEIIPVIKQKKISVGIDAFAEEGINKNWLSVPNSFFTPHIGYYTKESEENRNRITLENIKSFLEGKPQNVVS